MFGSVLTLFGKCPLFLNNISAAEEQPFMTGGLGKEDNSMSGTS